MKLQHILFLQMWLLLVSASAGEPFNLPFKGVEVENVAGIEISVSGVEKSMVITDRKWITKFIGLVSPKDYPVTKGAMSFSLPPEVAQVTLRDKGGKVLAKTTLYGAWNLMATANGGSRKLGSNRKLAAFILRKIKDSHPKMVTEWQVKYRDQISGVYKREYRDAIKSEQADADQPATAVDSKSEGGKKSKPESKGRSQ